jgi:hypothetical protein
MQGKRIVKWNRGERYKLGEVSLSVPSVLVVFSVVFICWLALSLAYIKEADRGTFALDGILLIILGIVFLLRCTRKPH